MKPHTANTTETKLNRKQINLLLSLYKFRFTTAPLLTQYFNLKSNSIIRNLQKLQNLELIYRQYSSTYKIDRKPAIYYLDKKGIAALRKNPLISKPVLHSYYKNHLLEESFIQHSLDVFAVFNVMEIMYKKDEYDIFTKNELYGNEDFPDIKPDLYLRGTTTDQEYFLTLVHDLPPFVLRKQFLKVVDHSETYGWPKKHYPTLLYIFKTQRQQRAFMSYANNIFEDLGITDQDLLIGTTLFETVTNLPENRDVWLFNTSDKIAR